MFASQIEAMVWPILGGRALRTAAPAAHLSWLQGLGLGQAFHRGFEKPWAGEVKAFLSQKGLSASSAVGHGAGFWEKLARDFCD